MKKKLVASLLVAAMVVSLAACGSKDNGSVGGAAENSTEAGTVVEGVSEAGSYTYQSTASAPNTWSPTDWENADEDLIMSYTTTYLYDFVMNEAKDGYDIIPEMASEMPIDVTSEYAGKYNVPEDATEGYAWTINLNESACWEDGTPITAHDYEYTMQQFLNPEMKNYRASSWYSGTTALANAQGYYGGGSMPVCDSETGEYAEVADEEMFFNFDSACPFFGDGSMNDYYGYGYDDADAAMDALAEACGAEGDIALTEEAKELLLQVAAGFGDSNPEAYKEFCFYKDASAAASWEDVGFVVNGDYSITLIFTSANTEFYVCYGTTGLMLVNETLYEANKQQTGDIVKSSYGTAMDKYMSYGPYKIASYQEDKEMTFTKNENWYGYTDGKHEGQYMTTDIKVSYITEHTTELSLFLQGNLDEVGLTSEDMDTYGNSDYILFQPESYTYKYTFNSDIDTLKSEESDGINHSILAYDDFRHAISLSVDRTDYVQSCTAAHEPGYGLLNYIYMCDPTTGELYRDSEYAEAALCKVYGVENADDITGYDPEAAAVLFQAAYDQAVADGNIKDTDRVELDMHVYGSDATYQKLVDFLQDAINNATVGTSLEGKVTIKLVEDQDYYSSLEAGLADIAITAWGGADMDPYSIVECYFSDTYKLEYGFQPTVEKCVVTIDGQDIEKTYYDWFDALCNGEYKTADLDVKNNVLSQLEANFLLEYECVPMSYRTASALVSQRLVYGSEEFINSLVGYGGIRFMAYTMDDAEWAAYCAEQNNQLTY